MVGFLGAREFGYEASLSIWFSGHLYHFKELKLLFQTFYLLNLFDGLRFLHLVFHGDLSGDQLRVIPDSEVVSANLSG